MHIATTTLSSPNYSAEKWLHYFTRNKSNLMQIDWQDTYQLTASEVKTILSSLQQFQLGESSEGHHLRRQAQHYVKTSGNENYPLALDLFIQEEQRHARDLGRFMEHQNLPLKSSHWVDNVFRFLRRFANLELSITVLTLAEIIAMVYYKALREATHAPILRQICHQILKDEIKHLEFQKDTLHDLQLTQHPWRIKLMRGVTKILFTGTLVVVWGQHQSVFRAGGFSFKSYWQANWQRFATIFS